MARSMTAVFVVLCLSLATRVAASQKILVLYKRVPTSLAAKTMVSPRVEYPTKRVLSDEQKQRYREAISILERTVVVTIPDSQVLARQIQSYAADPNVEDVRPDLPMRLFSAPTDPQYSSQWALKNTAQTGNHDVYDPSIGVAGRDVEAEQAWLSQTGSTSVVVAIIDAGISWAHEDLASNIWSNSAETLDGTDNDSNGYIDDVRGWDFGSIDNNPNDDCSNSSPLANSNGHGTHVTGIAGAVGNNGIGISGISWNSKIMPLKVANGACGINTSDVVDAINYARANGADVINLSLGGSSTPQLQAAISAAYTAGVVVVAAAGNEGTDDFTDSYPAAYTGHVISVAATDRNDAVASFSNYGTWITLAAPGVALRSTYPNSSYAYLSGTSMASPLVAGIAALVLSENPGLSPSDVRTRLTNACENIDAHNSSTYHGKVGAGRINASRALFSLNRVSPSTGSLNTTVTVSLEGQNFLSGMTLALTRSGQVDIFASSVNVKSLELATATFSLNGALGGRWTVTITSGIRQATLSDGFAVISSSFDVLSLNPTLTTTKSLVVAAGTTTLIWPSGVLGYGISLDMNAVPALPAVQQNDPFSTTGIGVELLPSSSSLVFQRPFSLVLPYQLSDLPNPNQPSSLTIARYDENTGLWIPLNSTVDLQSRQVTASISHLSTFALVQHTATSTVHLNRVIVYPNPFRVDRGHSGLFFKYLTAGARVRVYDISGVLIRDLLDTNEDGWIEWDAKTESAEPVASGIYFYLVTNPSGQRQSGRLGILR